MAKYRARLRIDEHGVTDDFLDERATQDKYWYRMDDIAPSSFGGVWVKVEHDDENP